MFKKFYDAEKNLKIDYIDFAHKIRKAYEAFALEEEAERRRLDVVYNICDIVNIIKKALLHGAMPFVYYGYMVSNIIPFLQVYL